MFGFMRSQWAEVGGRTAGAAGACRGRARAGAAAGHFEDWFVVWWDLVVEFEVSLVVVEWMLMC